MVTTRISKNLEETAEIAREIMFAVNRKKETAFVIFLRGNLGTGKTTLTKEVAKVLGVKSTVISPTFILQKKYETKDARFKSLIHIDAYRFDTPQEADVLVLDEPLQEKTNLIIIEWPEKMGRKIKPDMTIKLMTMANGSKKITW